MGNRAWRQSVDVVGTGARELYPTDTISPNVDPDQLFKLPTLVKTFIVTVPENRFEANSGFFVIGVLETKANYKFS